MINLQLEVQEVEAVLNHLAKGLFADVANLIAKIRTQAIPQVQPAEPTADPAPNPEADNAVVEPSQH
jgi:hypothetical protein